VRLGKAMGYTVLVIDPSAEAADFPEADVVLKDPAEAGARAGAATIPRFAVVATQGQWDEEATTAALALQPAPAYLGVMASGKRFGEMRALLGETLGAGAFARVKNPAGLDLGATLPEEIALSILAEIIGQRRAATKANASAGAAANGATAPAAAPPPGRRVRLTQVGESNGAATAGEQARDPVCGMMVTVAGAAHRAEHEGRAFYFCCGGCRARFLASPAQFLGQEARS